MISSPINCTSLDDYKEQDEQFIYGIKGIVRLSIAREIIYSIGYASTPDYFTAIPCCYKIECIFAVTDKRIILIPTDSKYKPISFGYTNIDVLYRDQLFDKVFLLNIKDKKFLSFCENKLVFRIYARQNSELNKINSVIKEHALV